jgi:hypothetical protein
VASLARRHRTDFGSFGVIDQIMGQNRDWTGSSMMGYASTSRERDPSQALFGVANAVRLLDFARATFRSVN